MLMTRKQPVAVALPVQRLNSPEVRVISCITADMASDYLSSVLRLSLISGSIILIIDLLIGIL